MLLTLILILAFIPVYLVGIRKNGDTSFFFTKDYTTVLKGACAIVVILVHIPVFYSNKLQDAIGSFAYVAVSVFFMVSAYGMEYSYEKKKDYLKRFWRNRIISLFVPLLLINVIAFLLVSYASNALMWEFLYGINDYIICLLEYCLLFYILKIIGKKMSLSTCVVDSLLIGSVLLISLVSYLANIYEIPVFRWCYERYGLIWGLLLYRYKDQFLAWCGKKSMYKILTLFIMGLVLGVAYLKFKSVWFWGEYLLKVVLGLALILLLLTSTARISFGNSVSRWLGKISYEVYLSHLVIIAFLEIAFSQLNSGYFIAITIIGTIITSTFVNALSSKIVAKLRK